MSILACCCLGSYRGLLSRQPLGVCIFFVFVTTTLFRPSEQAEAGPHDEHEDSDSDSGGDELFEVGLVVIVLFVRFFIGIVVVAAVCRFVFTSVFGIRFRIIRIRKVTSVQIVDVCMGEIGVVNVEVRDFSDKVVRVLSAWWVSER